jgi:hypothetical protein
MRSIFAPQPRFEWSCLYGLSGKVNQDAPGDNNIVVIESIE